MKEAGILMPVTSLPSKFGVGDFGRSAYQFIDILKQMHMKVWQVLPLNPLGYGNSPYQAYSSFAGDELYISPEKLLNDGLLSPNEIYEFNAVCNKIDYEKVRQHKSLMLEFAFNKFKTSNLQANYQQFVATTPWLKNYAVFLTFKKVNGLKPWNIWPIEQKLWIKNHQLNLDKYQEQIDYEQFIQFIFYRQWQQLKTYANSNGITLMGDIPIYTGFDSLDVWQYQDMFLLDEQQNPTHVAGVPPDYFSSTGQRWGNPLYNWQALKENNFNFWIDRLRGSTKMFDTIRIDHFRAFDTYWKIPSSCDTAIDGEWVEAPGYALFDKIYQELPKIKIVAEDLGDMREQVYKLRDHYNLKGMKVFQFMFDQNSNNSELTNTYNTIVYSGTHDNNTLLGWINSLATDLKSQITQYFVAPDIINEIIKFILRCDASTVIFPLQDILGLDESARLNTPSQIGSPNWEWKLVDFATLTEKTALISQLVVEAKRA